MLSSNDCLFVLFAESIISYLRHVIVSAEWDTGLWKNDSVLCRIRHKTKSSTFLQQNANKYMCLLGVGELIFSNLAPWSIFSTHCTCKCLVFSFSSLYSHCALFYMCLGSHVKNLSPCTLANYVPIFLITILSTIHNYTVTVTVNSNNLLLLNCHLVVETSWPFLT